MFTRVTAITPWLLGSVLDSPDEVRTLEQPVLLRAVGKLADAGERAGLSVEEMIRILNAGVTVENLLELIALKMQEGACHPSRSVN